MEGAISKPIILPDQKKVEGKGPLVLIGPNGTGKTKLGVTIATQNDGDRIPASRLLNFGHIIEMKPLHNADSELHRQTQERKGQSAAIASEGQSLLNRLKAEDAESAIAYRNASLQGELMRPQKTTLHRVTELWHRHFPGRTMELDYKTRVQSKLGKSQDDYTVDAMSDGERVGLFLIARVLQAPTGIVIIDEPETHFHHLLARKLWDDLEKARPDCRFVYITHDLPFALSRRNAEFGIVKSADEVELLPVNTSLPDALIETILGAASFSVVAKHIVFCEGKAGGLYDHALYDAWFDDNDTAVIPVDSCTDVIKCVEAFNNKHVVKGAKAIGIIDRDYLPEKQLIDYENNPDIHVLGVHEAESLFCLPKIFYAVAMHLKKSQDTSIESYTNFIEKARQNFREGKIAGEILERARKAVECHLVTVQNKLKPNRDLDTMRENFIQSLEPLTWGFDPKQLFDDAASLTQKALDEEPEIFLKIFPGKSYLALMAAELGIEKETYVNLVCKVLKSSLDENESDINLRIKIEEALTPYLPSRKFNDAILVHETDKAA